MSQPSESSSSVASSPQPATERETLEQSPTPIPADMELLVYVEGCKWPHMTLKHLDAFSRLFNSEMLSDLKIKCDSETFHAHLNILSIRTNFFLDAVSSGFEESEQRTVTLRDTNPATVWGLLKWCYTGDIREDVPGKYLKHAGEVGRNPAFFFTSLYILADMLVIQELKNFCARKVEEFLSSGWTSAVAKDFGALSQMVYDNTEATQAEELRRVVIATATERHEELLKCPEYCDVQRQNSELAADLLDSVVEFYQKKLVETSANLAEKSAKELADLLSDHVPLDGNRKILCPKFLCRKALSCSTHGVYTKPTGAGRGIMFS